MSASLERESLQGEDALLTAARLRVVVTNSRIREKQGGSPQSADDRKTRVEGT